MWAIVIGTLSSLLLGNKNNAFFKHKDANSNVNCGIAEGKPSGWYFISLEREEAKIIFLLIPEPTTFCTKSFLRFGILKSTSFVWKIVK